MCCASCCSGGPVSGSSCSRPIPARAPSATLEALAAGAADFIDKQSLNLMDLDRLGRELGDRLRALGGGRDTHLRRVRPEGGARRGAALPLPTSVELAKAEVCVIGASTGGPAALQGLLEAIPRNFRLPIAIVQHMPPGFTRPFAAVWTGYAGSRWREAEEGERLEPGKVLHRAGGNASAPEPPRWSRPSLPSRGRPATSPVWTCCSAPRPAARPGRVLGVLLTGMGDDGAEGLSLIRAQGGITIAESEESCVVYGMPRAAVERGAAQSAAAVGYLEGDCGGM